ncbi:MAG: response regulator transcription factor [Clostridium celatum]|uniref:response regulator transcription factor n=1 Tax=uncultured Clostridium sp. TaxID=59620 RepID=UPI0025CEEBAA|nr:response regulator transcription factor [uncultured Clostridium sp.]MDU4884057.1 response regulator transcription factor [Clostridium celatum]MDU5262063.1 response regulator transcription factor [Clostridium celatum]MDU7077887.1 response regulator transcription factor [Clostridium celatum]
MKDKLEKVLIVDDDIHINELIDMYLKSGGYSTKKCFNGNDACNIVESEDIGLVILDVMLPGRDGIEVLKYIRKNSDVPVIMLTAKGEVFDKVLALELGADDYMVKPFDPKELLARVKAVTRRYTVDNQSKDVIKYSDLTIDIGAYEVTYKGSTVKLAPKELELLHFMASNPNKVFTREQLMYEVWGYDYPGDSRTVDVHIKRLREKVKGGENWELQTVWGVGYKFEVR